jgi:hypothetical protein
MIKKCDYKNNTKALYYKRKLSLIYSSTILQQLIDLNPKYPCLLSVVYNRACLNISQFQYFSFKESVFRIKFRF